MKKLVLIFGLFFIAAIGFADTTSGPFNSVKIVPSPLPVGGPVGELRVDNSGDFYLRSAGSWDPVGTVTSVGFITDSNFTVSGQPITSSGNITLNLANTINVDALRLDDGFGDYVQLISPSLAGSLTFVMPNSYGSAGQFLQTDGLGNLTFATSGGGGANTNLSNLGAVSVNTNLNPDGNNTRNLGSSSFHWANLFIGLIQSSTGIDLGIESNDQIYVDPDVDGGGGTNQFNVWGSAALRGDDTSAPKFLFYDQDDSNYVAFKSPEVVSGNITFTVPGVDGSSGQALVTNGAGALTFATVAGANTSLSNLTATSINTALRPNTNEGQDLGSTSLNWSVVWAQAFIYTGTGTPLGIEAKEGIYLDPDSDASGNEDVRIFGGVELHPDGGGTQAIKFYDADNTNFSAIQAVNDLTADVTLTAPTVSGALATEAYVDAEVATITIGFNYVQSIETTGGAWPFGSSTLDNLGSITLTAGDWEIDAQLQQSNGGLISSNNLYLNISDQSGVDDFDDYQEGDSALVQKMDGPSGTYQFVKISRRVQIGSTTTYYLKAMVDVSTNINYSGWRFSARRLRD